jgi:hypothetical protein
VWADVGSVYEFGLVPCAEAVTPPTVSNETKATEYKRKETGRTISSIGVEEALSFGFTAMQHGPSVSHF